MASQSRSPPFRDYDLTGVNGALSPRQEPSQQALYASHSEYNEFGATGAYGYEEYGSNPYDDHQDPNYDRSRQQYERQNFQHQSLRPAYNSQIGYHDYSARSPYGTTPQDQSSYTSGTPNRFLPTDAYDEIVDDYGSGRHPGAEERVKTDGVVDRAPLLSFESVRHRGSNRRPGIATRMDKILGPEANRRAPQPHTAPSTPSGQSFPQKQGRSTNGPERSGLQHEQLPSGSDGRRPGTAPGAQTTASGRPEANGFDFNTKHSSRGESTERNPQRPPMHRGLSDSGYNTQQNYQGWDSLDDRAHNKGAMEDDEEMPNFQSIPDQSNNLMGNLGQSNNFTPYRPFDKPKDRPQKTDIQPRYNEGSQSYSPPKSNLINGRPDQERAGFDRGDYKDPIKPLNRDGLSENIVGRPIQPRERPSQQGQPPKRPRPPGGPSRSRTMDEYQSGRDRRRPPDQGYGQGIPPGGMRTPTGELMDQQRRPQRLEEKPRFPPVQQRPIERSERNQREMPMRERQPKRLDPSQRGANGRFLDQSGQDKGPGSNTEGYANRPETAGEGRERGISGRNRQRPGLQERNSDGDTSRSPPAPVRPGLTQSTEGGRQPTRPPPVRHYTTETSGGNVSGHGDKRKSAPITLFELSQLKDMAGSNPSDHQLQLRLARKLAEAAIVLADEGGHADARTRDRNLYRYNQDALNIVTRLASEKNPDAMFYLAECHGDGSLGLAADPKEAFNLYQSAAKLNHPAAAYRTAVCCEIGPEDGGGTRQDFSKATQWYRRAASLGDVGGNYKMGIILLDGLLDQQRSVGEAVTFLKRAAEHADEEHPHALYELGRLYESREYSGILPRDDKLALQQFSRAAKLGHRNSQFRLGKAYEYGLLTCPIDARNSIYWYTKAASQGQHESELALSGWYLTGSDGILDQSDTEAYLWARKAAMAEPPLSKAMFAMGYFTEVGIGCPRSLDEAKRWYGRAATQNFQKAQERLEELNRGGINVQRGRERLSRSNPKQNENCTVM